MANTAGSEGMYIPRRWESDNRCNIKSSTLEYWRRIAFVPFMDHFNNEFGERFSQLENETDS